MDKYNSSTTIFGGSSGAHTKKRTSQSNTKPKPRDRDRYTSKDEYSAYDDYIYSDEYVPRTRGDYPAPSAGDERSTAAEGYRTPVRSGSAAPAQDRRSAQPARSAAPQSRTGQPARSDTGPRQAGYGYDDYDRYDSRSGRSAKKKKPKWKKRLVILGVVVVLLAGMYLTAVYSQIPFIKNLRTLYIETAMNTFTHHWLAEAFIPHSVIDKVMAEQDAKLNDNIVDSSDLPPGAIDDRPEDPPDDPVVTPPEDTDPTVPDEPPPPPDNGRDDMLALFYELDPATVPEDMECHDLQIKDIEDMGIKTTAGDPVWAIDVPNKLIILSIYGSADIGPYKGKLAIVRDSSQVMLAANTHSGRGTNLTELCEQYGAVLGINASGFDDPNGKGRGDDCFGLLISNGEQLFKKTNSSQYQIAGYDYDNNFRVGSKLELTELRDAMQFKPIIVLNGAKATDLAMGIQPRTAIGQTADKSTLMLIIDGRQPTHSIGTTTAECADILLRYGCFNAMNMDGGSSSSMTYMGEMITKTSSPQTGGRYLPDAWVVKGTVVGADSSTGGETE